VSKEIKEIREKTLDQLHKEIGEVYKKLREVRFKVANREVKDTNEKSKIRKKISMMWTIIREKEAKKLENKE